MAQSKTQIEKTTDASSAQPLLDTLYAGLSGREIPEAVAALVAPLVRDQLIPAERSVFGRGIRSQRRAAKGSAAGFGSIYADLFDDDFESPYSPVVDSVYGPYGSLMSTKFEGAAPLSRQACVLAEIAGFTSPSGMAGDSIDYDRDPVALVALLAFARAQIGMAEGRNDFKADRLDKPTRRAQGLVMSRRRYDKLFRVITHLEELRAERAEQRTMFALKRFAKTVFAADLSRDRFGRDPLTAAFVAYMAANLGRRSLFTNGRQAGAFDERAVALFAALERQDAVRAGSTDWFAAAHVFPRADVLDRVSVEDRAELLDKVLGILDATASRLEAIAIKGEINTTTMIVRRGNDSSSWNALAGAWNKARDYWVALVHSLGQEAMFETFLPGKVMRLMAADVARWHEGTDGGLHDDTPIWAALPKPWEVMGVSAIEATTGAASGPVICGRPQIEAVCHALGVDPEKTGWTKPRARIAVDVTRPTPETVHGVVIGHPALAAFLRRIDAFGGHGHRVRWDRLPQARAELLGELGGAMAAYAGAKSGSGPETSDLAPAGQRPLEA